MVELQKIFDVSYGSKLDLNKMNLMNPSIDFVGRSGKNNGITARVDEIDNFEPYRAGLLTVALGGSVLSTFLQNNKFYTAQNVAVLEPLTEMSIQEKLFYCHAIKSNAFRFSTCGREANRTLRNLLVPSLDEIPGWVNEVNVTPFVGAEKPLTTDIKIALDMSNWEEFTYQDLFDIKKGVRLTKAQMLVGNTPFIGSTDSNNGLTNKVGQPAIHNGNVITINYNGSVGESFYQPVPFWASDDVNVLYPKKEHFQRFNIYIALFMIPLFKAEQYRFNYGRKWHTDRMKISTIKLPINADKSLDLNLMENYVKTLPFSSSI